MTNLCIGSEWHTIWTVDTSVDGSQLKMKLAIKYGSIIALGVIGWVLISNFLLHPDPNSGAVSFTVLLFNALPILCLFLGINEKRKLLGTPFVMGQGIATGASIIVVYIVLASLFFLAMGSRLLAAQSSGPDSASLAQHFFGFVAFAMFGGLFYSTIVSFIVLRWEKRQ